MAKPSTAGADASRVRVQPERRPQPDLAKLAAALIELATGELNTTNIKNDQAVAGTAGTVAASDKDSRPAVPSRRRGAA